MGGCCSKDPDAKTSWSPAETNNASTTSTIVAQPNMDDTSTGVFTQTATTVTTMKTITIGDSRQGAAADGDVEAVETVIVTTSNQNEP